MWEKLAKTFGDSAAQLDACKQCRDEFKDLPFSDDTIGKAHKNGLEKRLALEPPARVFYNLGKFFSSLSPSSFKLSHPKWVAAKPLIDKLVINFNSVKMEVEHENCGKREDYQFDSFEKKYELQRQCHNVLGKGGFGSVYRGKEKSSGMEVAIKEVLASPFGEKYMKGSPYECALREGLLRKQIGGTYFHCLWLVDCVFFCAESSCCLTYSIVHCIVFLYSSSVPHRLL